LNRVALLEPDQWRRLGIAVVLSEAGVVIVEDAVDLVLMAFCVTTQSGLGEIARVRTRYDAEVLILDHEQSVETAANVLRAGARGYFAMDGEPATLVNAVEVVSRGGVWGPREALLLLAQPPAVDDDLEPQQRAVLECLHEGLTNKEIGHRLGLAEATIKARMNRLYRRFGVTTRLQLLAAAIKRGIVEIRKD
jgi:DNA-binding NarL/FixJ family response regulator